MKRVVTFIYGLLCYGVFFVTLLYAIGFLGNFGVPKSIDSGAEGDLGTALGVDALLLSVFAVQHSVMARQWFKRRWKKVVGEAAERSTYVLISSLALLLLFWKWQPIGGVIWEIESDAGRAVVWGLYAAGLLIVLLSTFMINHFDLFGLRQVWLYLVGKRHSEPEFRVPMFYRFVRHPLYVGWIVTFWAAPVMTSAHLFFAIMTTTYIFVAIRFEENDLISMHGDNYLRYRADVPMIVPSLKPKARTPSRAVV